MPDECIFVPLETQQLEERLKAISVHDLVAITLVDGMILLGGIFKHWEWNGQDLSIAFNTPKGQRFGSSCTVDVPLGLIADLSVVPLSDSSAPRLTNDEPEIQMLKRVLGESASIDLRILPQDYPDPLASIIYNHNTHVASVQHLHFRAYMERALSRDAIPPQGIEFEDDLLLYADWEFFDRQMPGPLSITGGIPGILEFSKDLSRSPQQRVLQRLKEHVLQERVRRKVLPTVGECLLQGHVHVNQPPDTTEIEGQECHLWLVVGTDGESWPALVKVAMLKYPFEFIERVNSMLAFYGELLPVPVRIFDTLYKRVLLTRAMAYVEIN